jgi:hypothetical protein
LDVLSDIGRFAGFVALVALFVTGLAWCQAKQQRYVRDGLRSWTVLLAFVGEMATWAGLFVVIFPITGVLSSRLLLYALVLGAVPALLGWVMSKLLRVRSGQKSSWASASLLIGVRHPWAAALGARLPLMGALSVLGVVIEGLIVLVVAPSNPESAMFRLVFITFFLAGLPLVVTRTLLLTIPVLDNNSRDGLLASGFTAIIMQLLALGLLLSSFNVSRPHGPFGLSAVQSLPTPLIALPLAYFILTTAVPYAIGVRALRKLYEECIAAEEEVKDKLESWLTVPKFEIYADVLRESMRDVDERRAKLKNAYFYLALHTEPVDAVQTFARAMKTGEVGVASTLFAPRSNDEVGLFGAGRLRMERGLPAPSLLKHGGSLNQRDDESPGEGDGHVGAVGNVHQGPSADVDVAAEGRDLVHSDIDDNESSDAASLNPVASGLMQSHSIGREGDEQTPVPPKDDIGLAHDGDRLPIDETELVADGDMQTLGDVVEELANEQGLSRGDHRRKQLELVVESFESQARYADPAFIHFEWLGRMRTLIDGIRTDLASRGSPQAMEAAALSWSHVAGKQKLALAHGEFGHGRKPGGVVAITAVGGLLLTGFIDVAGSELWHAFVHAAQ